MISWPVACFASAMRYNVLFFRGPVLWPIARRNSPLSSGPSLPLALLLQGCSLFLNHGQETRAERLPGIFYVSYDASGLT